MTDEAWRKAEMVWMYRQLGVTFKEAGRRIGVSAACASTLLKQRERRLLWVTLQEGRRGNTSELLEAIGAPRPEAVSLDWVAKMAAALSLPQK